jgi:hypothetical protein
MSVKPLNESPTPSEAVLTMVSQRPAVSPFRIGKLGDEIKL